MWSEKRTIGSLLPDSISSVEPTRSRLALCRQAEKRRRGVSGTDYRANERDLIARNPR